MAVALMAGLGLAVIAGSIPPPDAARLPVAHRLALAVPILDELGVDGWRDEGGCHDLWFDMVAWSAPAGDTCAGENAFMPQTQAAFDRVAAAVDDAVPNGRVVEISRAVDWTDATTEAEAIDTIDFVVAPRVLWGVDSPVTRWRWTWHEEAIAPGPDGLDAHWSFGRGGPLP